MKGDGALRVRSRDRAGKDLEDALEFDHLVDYTGAETHNHHVSWTTSLTTGAETHNQQARVKRYSTDWLIFLR